MDFIDQLNSLSARIESKKSSVLTEEATKTAFVLPFVQSLGYDVFNPDEVVPELTADHGVKKGEKVDYAILRDKQVIILIECKPVGSNLESNHAGQLFRYFSVTEARFGILTDGIRYVFYSDLEKENKMDDKPFFEFNLLDFDENQVEELKKFTRSAFDLETIIGTASDLMYHKALTNEIYTEFDSPSEEFIRLFTNKVYGGRLTQQVRDKFHVLIRNALKDFIREKVNNRLKSALETDKSNENISSSDLILEVDANSQKNENGIITTEEEKDAFRIIQAIGAEIIDPARIIMRDAKSYCAVLIDDNNRRPVSRFFFGKNKLAISIFCTETPGKIEITSVLELYKYKQDILQAIQKYA